MSNTQTVINTTRHNVGNSEGELAVAITEILTTEGITYYRVDAIQQGFLRDDGMSEYGPIVYMTDEKVREVIGTTDYNEARRVANAMFRDAKRNGSWGNEALNRIAAVGAAVAEGIAA